MKNLHPIHQSPEEKLASSSERTVAAVERGTKEVVKAVSSIKPTVDLSPLSRSQDVQNRKLEEVKSATLATNIQLKRIEKLLGKEPSITVKLTII